MKTDLEKMICSVDWQALDHNVYNAVDVCHLLSELFQHDIEDSNWCSIFSRLNEVLVFRGDVTETSVATLPILIEGLKWIEQTRLPQILRLILASSFVGDTELIYTGSRIDAVVAAFEELARQTHTLSGNRAKHIVASYRILAEHQATFIELLSHPNPTVFQYAGRILSLLPNCNDVFLPIFHRLVNDPPNECVYFDFLLLCGWMEHQLGMPPIFQQRAFANTRSGSRYIRQASLVYLAMHRIPAGLDSLEKIAADENSFEDVVFVGGELWGFASCLMQSPPAWSN